MTDLHAVGADVVAIIPARGGSKGVPGKNLAPVGGRSLLARCVDAAIDAGVGHVIVSTDAADIAREAERCGAVTVWRPAELATDEASSESAVIHALGQLEAQPDITVFLQCTSPFIDAIALAAAIERVRGGADSVFAARESHAFLWRAAEDDAAIGVNHDAARRLRRQDRPSEWVETGSFYAMRTSGFLGAGHRFFGRIEIQTVAETDALEIDTPADLRVARALARDERRLVTLPDVDALVTDFDGVHTDDAAIVNEHGLESVRVNRRDGHGVKLLRDAGVSVLILSTETNPVVARRAEKLRVPCLHGIDDKAAALRGWLEDHGLDPARVAYLGNDVNDLGCLHAVGVPICVADAHAEVMAVARHVTGSRGGDGAVREVAEAILAGRG